ncbi:hypothetical protein DV736_g1456, partial [Chaetothyriales sp. CBS 134916]
MSFFILHVAACSPDSGFTELPLNKQQYSDSYAHEHIGLLEAEDDGGCCCDVYTEQPANYSCSFLARQQRPRRSARGCKKLLLSLAHLLCYCRSLRRYQLLTRYRYAKQKKPYSAISVLVEQLTSETYEEDDLAGVPDLLEAIKLQATGPTEAARAVRKKLKYGNVHRQLRALAILDGLLQNGAPRTQRALLADAPLLERLRIAATDPVSDVDVRNKCKDLFSQWVASAKTNPGLEGAASLYNALPRQKKPMTAQQRREQSRVLRETEEDVAREAAADSRDEARSRSGSVVSSAVNAPTNTLRKSSTATSPVTLSISSTFGMDKKSKKAAKNKGRVLFNLDREKPAILQSIAASSVASTNLLNGLKLVNRETTSVSSEPEVMKRFETCKQLRRQILRYIQYVETDELLGGLIHANEELVEALMAFEVLDKSIVDDDSDSEVEEAVHQSREARKRDEADARDAAKAVAAMSLHREQPPRRPARPGVGRSQAGGTTNRLAPSVGLSFTSAPPTGHRQQQQGSRPKGKARFDDEEDDYEKTVTTANAAPVRGTNINIGGARRAPYGFREV